MYAAREFEGRAVSGALGFDEVSWSTNLFADVGLGPPAFPIVGEFGRAGASSATTYNAFSVPVNGYHSYWAAPVRYGTR